MFASTQAPETTVRLRCNDGCLRVIVKDNGNGFSPSGYDRGDWPGSDLRP